jgi:hypothetical protein
VQRRVLAAIEGENLALPQAKSYLGACAAGPMIRRRGISDPYALSIELTICERVRRSGPGPRAPPSCAGATTSSSVT